jgi:hypothetical protein
MIFMGEYSATTMYIGNDEIIMMVKQGTLYYMTMTTSGAFSNVSPSVDTAAGDGTTGSVWKRFSGSFKSVATELLLAESALIAGWKFEDGVLKSQGGAGLVILDGRATSSDGSNPDNTDPRIAIGKPFADRRSAPFRVYEDGTLYASKARLSGDLTVGGNVHVNEDGTIVAKGGRFDGFLSLPFKRLEDSDSTHTGTNYNIHNYVLGDYSNIISGNDAPNNRDRIYLPKNASWNGRIISIINRNPAVGEDLVGLFYATTIAIQGGDSFLENLSSVPSGYVAPATVTLRAGMIQFCCIVIDNAVKWLILTTTKNDGI